jgi:hypothetical protein
MTSVRALFRPCHTGSLALFALLFLCLRAQPPEPFRGTELHVDILDRSVKLALSPMIKDRGEPSCVNVADV